MSKDRQTVRITLFDDSDMETTIEEAAQWLRGLADQVPPEYRDKSVFRVEADSDYYGGYTLDFEAYYDRPETDEEMEARQAKERHAAALYLRDRELLERQQLTALKAKYEGE